MATHNALNRVGLLGAAIVLATAAAGSAQVSDDQTYGRWGFDLTGMDRRVAPGDDFWAYANGAWLARTTIPADQTIDTLRTRIADRNTERLAGIMRRAAGMAPAFAATLEEKVGAFYAAFMDEARAESLGAEPIASELSAIRAVDRREQMVDLMGRAPASFYASLWVITQDLDLKDVAHYGMITTQGGLGLPNRDYYLNPEFAKERRAYHDYIARLLTLIQWPSPAENADAVLAYETRIAAVSWTRAEQRDLDHTYHRLDRAQLAALTPSFSWARYMMAAGLDGVDHLIIAEDTAFPKIAQVYDQTPLEVLKAWQAFTVADNAATYLSAPFVEARFAFRDRVLAGQPNLAPRWKRGVRAVAGGNCLNTRDRLDCFGSMGEGAGELYAAAYFPPKEKATVTAMVVEIRAAMRARLERLDWMSQATKAEALKKLDSYQIKVGTPDKPRDYSGLMIRADDLVGDVRRTLQWDWRFYAARAAGPVDFSDWIMTPQTNDAYNGSFNDVVFPAGIFQRPMFDAAWDPAVYYGALGAFIGHEFTHGFDDQGAKIDSTAALRNWWTPADATAFKARSQALADQFSAYEPLPDVHVNGRLTLGENIADLGGLSIALEAYRRSLRGTPAPVIDGFTGDQRVFLGWAQVWRGKARDDYLRRQVVSDPHAPRKFRVVGPLRNMDAWYEAFGVRPGQAYYVPAEHRVRIW